MISRNLKSNDFTETRTCTVGLVAVGRVDPVATVFTVFLEGVKFPAETVIHYSIITIQSTNECTGPMNSRTLLLRLLPFNLKRTRSLTSVAGRKGKEVDRVQKPPQAGRLCLPRSRWKSSARTTRRLTTGYMRSSSLSRSMRNLRRSFRLFPPCAFLLRANAQRSLRSVHTAIKTIDNC
jgi:hypothetical protein